MESNGSGLEQRLSSLQTQIDGLRQAADDDVRPLDERLSTLTEYSASILKRWAATADRHARAVSELEAYLREMGDAGTRLQQDATQRLQDLERIVQQEWAAMRDLHEAPVRQLVEQAASLTEVCIATANSAQRGFDRAEARLATLEASFQSTTSELTREVQAVLAEVRQLSTAVPQQLAGGSPAWPLEGVTRLHHQLRESTASTLALPAAVPSGGSEDPPLQSRSLTGSKDPSLQSGVIESSPMEAERAVPEPTREASREPAPEFAPEPTRTRLLSRPVAAAVLVALIVAGGLAWRFQRDIRAAAERAEQSQRQSTAAAETATREAVERQEAAARQLDAARDLAARAQTIGDVLAAPDLVRYTLVSTGSLQAASGQVLWSRSRGFVFSASGLPAPPANATYQIWLLTRGGAVSAATFVPDAAGRVTITATVTVPRPVFSAIVTTERQGGAETPTADPVLVRLPVAPAAS